ncbi:PAAR/S-type pyocin domain-containing protein [Yersinia pekkanenii]|uniref:PAAR/S-type pyocin domain-containing protein n=2 Tax=Yersinia pekkanenii TaxID=1288385 RepID=A0A0T9RFJ2_9GAMM|nr:S-type pyocin domain-containing protein [Yersinia pekkanenii]CNI60319.1 PAAR/S-type pyocin domain-containing protein [Yersinia pekkanenii]
MGGYRTDCYGRGLALHGDKTTTGATICSTLPNCTEHGRAIVRVGDPTTACPKCGQSGRIVDGEPHSTWHGASAAVDRSTVRCGCPPGTNKVIAPKGQWLGPGPSPAQIAQEKQAAMLVVRQAEREAEAQRWAEERDSNRVFAKSCLRGDGCNDAGEAREPHTNFAEMGLFRVTPAVSPVTNSDVPQRAQTAKKKPSAPKPRSALYKWMFGNHEEMKYQAVTAAAASTVRAQAATAGAGVLEQVAGRFATSGTWAVQAGRVAAGGIGAPVAALLVGMMPGRLNDGEQDFIDRMRAEQMRDVPSRVRFTWENDTKGNPVPHGWHTPPGKDMVRLRRMEWDNTRKAYTFTTEEDNPITIIWTPDHSGVNVPSNTGNQARPVLPSTVIVDPLPESSGITTTTSPAPEEKNFADYILILPMPNIPPIYIYLSKPPVEFLEVELYSDFKRRSREGKYEADHMPSAAAVREYLKTNAPEMLPDDIDMAVQNVAAIVVPKAIHQKLSETYGGRNTRNDAAQIKQDALDLRAAVDRNLDAIKPALKNHGATESQIEAARTKMHKLNSDMGLYK